MAKKLPRNPASVRAAGLLSSDHGWRGIHVVWLQAAVIALVTLWIYSPALHGEWLWDDDFNIRDNSFIHDPLGFLKVWVHANGTGDYYPLTSFVWWLQWQHWSSNTFGFHVTNVVLHLLCGFLVWVLFARIGLRLAWLGGAAFVVHPIMVESVAWLSELKNTLSVPFLLLSMICWVQWMDGAANRLYGWSLVCFALSLLAKISGVVLPLVFLGHIWAVRGKLEWKNVRQVAPFFLVIAAVIIASILTQEASDPSPGVHPAATLAGRLTAVGWAAVFLLGKCLWPAKLLPVYEGFGAGPLSSVDLLPWIGLGGLSVILWRARKGWGRPFLLSLGFFYINLIPILGFIFLNYAGMVWAMDHILYFPVIGLIGLAVALLGEFESHGGPTATIAARVMVAVVIGLMALKTHAYDSLFRDTETLWGSDVLRDEPDLAVVMQNYGSGLFDHQKYAKAVPYLERAIQLDPGAATVWMELGDIAKKLGQPAQAESDYRQAITLAPKALHGYVDLGQFLLENGRRAEATKVYRKAAELAPESAQVHYNLGKILLDDGDLTGAVGELGRSETLDPSIAMTHESLGVALARSGKPADAIAEFRLALDLDAGRASTHFDLALALVRVGQVAQAIEEIQETVRLDPNNAAANAVRAKLRQAAPAPVQAPAQ